MYRRLNLRDLYDSTRSNSIQHVGQHGQVTSVGHTRCTYPSSVNPKLRVFFFFLCSFLRNITCTNVFNVTISGSSVARRGVWEYDTYWSCTWQTYLALKIGIVVQYIELGGKLLVCLYKYTWGSFLLWRELESIERIFFFFLPWPQALKILAKDTVWTMAFSPASLSVHFLACSFLRRSKLLIFRKWSSAL